MLFGRCVKDLMQRVDLLTHLNRLAVSGLDDATEVKITIDWHKLQALQELAICNCTISSLVVILAVC